MRRDSVVTVTTSDIILGVMPKLQAHNIGALHRAVSVFIFNSNGEWLLQKRASCKYHSGGLWSNSCCTHPYYNESYLQAAKRRCREEIGLSVPLTMVSTITYNINVGSGLSEHEYNYLFVGFSDNTPKLNKKEVEECRYISFSELSNEIRENPDRFTEWFKVIFRGKFDILEEANQCNREID